MLLCTLMRTSEHCREQGIRAYSNPIQLHRDRESGDNGEKDNCVKDHQKREMEDEKRR